ncbi:hypothetical protein ACEPPN_006261 [Leptodophora sp. 'Broadleaf-Isolate-01']
MERMIVPVLKNGGRACVITAEDERLYEEANKTTAMDQSQLPSQKQSQGKGKGKKKMEESGVLPSFCTGPEKRRREEIEKEWKAKEERDIAGRERVPGGYEDVVEMEKLRSLDGFVPTLRGANLKDYRRG